MEYWDLFDAARRPSGRRHKKGEPVPEGFYHQVIHLALFTEEGRLLSQKRSQEKRSWAGLWDISLSGSVKAGETPAEGLRREAKEELGLALPTDLKRPAFSVNGPHYFDDYFILITALDPDRLVLQKEEVEAVRLLTEEEAARLWRRRAFVPYDPAFLRYLFQLGRAESHENFSAEAYRFQIHKSGILPDRTS